MNKIYEGKVLVAFYIQNFSFKYFTSSVRVTKMSKQSGYFGCYRQEWVKKYLPHPYYLHGQIFPAISSQK